jgi:DNA ligase-1
MQAFANLLDRLSFTYSNNKKVELLTHFFKNTPDPERGYAIAIIAGTLAFPGFKRGLIKELISEQIDPYLFELSYDYVGDRSETVALLWKTTALDNPKPKPALSEIIQQFNHLPKTEVKAYIKQLFNQFNATERWALLKLSSSSLRIGVSARYIKLALAQYGNRDIHEIEHIWHGLQPPYLTLFSWLENKESKPDIRDNLFFHPVMLAQPLNDEELSKIHPELFAIERKIDGIRVQFIHTSKGKALFSRTGDDISAAFPEMLQLNFTSSVVLDGELVIKKAKVIGSFNDLQQRLNRKIPSKKLIQDSPAHIILYDILFLDQQDLRNLPFIERRLLLEQWVEKNPSDALSLSEMLTFNTNEELIQLKQTVLASQDIAVEGLMIKRKLSAYIAGRPSGQWYKWKRDPYLVDAVLMYAQRGHGKRSSFYSDYTFGLWQDNQLLPIGKAYFGFTDEELKQLDKWIRNHTLNRFGPVREVEKELVFEVAFDAVNNSGRHKSGFALRFPRINRIRWDKPAIEADHLDILKKYL